MARYPVTDPAEDRLIADWKSERSVDYLCGGSMVPAQDLMRQIAREIAERLIVDLRAELALHVHRDGVHVHAGDHMLAVVPWDWAFLPCDPSEDAGVLSALEALVERQRASIASEGESEDRYHGGEA